MNNENKARTKVERWVRTTWTMIFVMIITLFFGVENQAYAQVKETIVYNKYILYINKYNNLVNIKDIINIDYNNYINNKRNKSKRLSKQETVYLINDLTSRDTFEMPVYSKSLNLKNVRVDKRVIISRLANAIKSHETGGVGAYYRKSYSSSACGAYQYMPKTWNNFMGYKTACHAPEWVQDLRMINELKHSYEKYGSWDKAVAAHLSPARAKDRKLWNQRIHGNPTVAEYVRSVFDKANLVLA